MRELNVCLKLNFLSRKIPIFVGAALLVILCIEMKINNINIGMDNVYVLESLFLIIFAAYNYKNSFVYWVSMGGRRKDFYLSSFILFVFIAAVISYIQTLVFIHYESQRQIFMGQYGKFNLIEVVGFTPLGVWIYQFLSFMCSICAGALIGALNTRCELGEAIGISVGYFFLPNLFYTFIIRIFEEYIPAFIKSQGAVYLFFIIIYGISIYIGWRIIRREEDLCIE